MSMSEFVQPTLSDLLPDNLENLGKEVRAQLGKEGPAIGWPFVEKQVVSGLRTSLAKVDLLEQLAQAWVTVAAVRACRAQGPGESAVVPLRDHKLSFTAKPTLRLKLGEATLPDLRFTYLVTAALQDATLSIREGRLVAAAPGKCVFSAALSFGQVPLHAPWSLGHLPLPAEREFQPGWRIP
jgi:hypothetical protein